MSRTPAPTSRLARALRGAAMAGSLLVVAGVVIVLGNAMVPSFNRPRMPFGFVRLLAFILLLGITGATYGGIFGFVSGSAAGVRGWRLGTLAGASGGMLAGGAAGVVFLALGDLLPAARSPIAWALFATFIACCAVTGAWAAPHMQAMLGPPREPTA